MMSYIDRAEQTVVTRCEVVRYGAIRCEKCLDKAVREAYSRCKKSRAPASAPSFRDIVDLVFVFGARYPDACMQLFVTLGHAMEFATKEQMPLVAAATRLLMATPEFLTAPRVGRLSATMARLCLFADTSATQQRALFDAIRAQRLSRSMFNEVISNTMRRPDLYSKKGSDRYVLDERHFPFVELLLGTEYLMPNIEVDAVNDDNVALLRRVLLHPRKASTWRLPLSQDTATAVVKKSNTAFSMRFVWNCRFDGDIDAYNFGPSLDVLPPPPPDTGDKHIAWLGRATFKSPYMTDAVWERVLHDCFLDYAVALMPALGSAYVVDWIFQWLMSDEDMRAFAIHKRVRLFSRVYEFRAKMFQRREANENKKRALGASD